MAECRDDTAEMRVETLLSELLESPHASWSRGLSELCEAHPELASSLREQYELFVRLEDGGTRSPVEDPVRFGDYLLTRELGRGGMGVVHLAVQTRAGIERTVALKRIREGREMSEAARQRFVREARALCRLDHPAICPVLDVGEVDETPFLAMRYVEGRTVADLLKHAEESGRLPSVSQSSSQDGSSRSDTQVTSSKDEWARWVECFEQLALGLQAAHDEGLVHRDVKPGNVMIAPSGDAVLLDFGLVQDDESELLSLTRTGQALGTPSYMAPEQISTTFGAVGPATDIYGLAATLYEVLTGRPPFTAPTREALYRQILEDEPQDLRRFDRSLPSDLSVVLETALRKSPDRRYASAREFAEDLRRVRTRQPIHARRVGLLTRTVLWSQRNRLAAVVLVLLALSQVGLVFAWRSSVQAFEQARLAEIEAGNREADALREAAAAADARERGELILGNTRKALTQLTRLAGEQLVDVPWLADLRSTILTSALDFHRAIAVDQEASDALRDQRASTQLAMSGVALELGDYATAVESARATLRLTESCDTWRRRIIHAGGHHALGMAERRRGDYVQAIDSWQEALDRKQVQFREGRINALQLFPTINSLAAALRDSGRFTEAQEVLDTAPEIDYEAQEPIVREQLDHWALMSGLVAVQTGDLEKAARHIDSSTERFRKRYERRPNSRQARFHLAESLMARGRLAMEMNELDRAAEILAESESHLDALVAAYPNLMSIRIPRLTLRNRLAILSRRTKDRDRAKELYESIIVESEELEQKHPDLGDVAGLRAMAEFNLGNLVRMNDPVGAREHYSVSLRVLDVALKQFPTNLDFLSIGADAAANAGTLAFMAAEADLGAEFFKRSRSYASRAVEVAPEDPRQHGRLALAAFNVGANALEVSDFERAKRSLGESFETRHAWVLKGTPSPRRWLEFLQSASRFSWALIEMGNCTEAKTVIEQTDARLAATTDRVRGWVAKDAKPRLEIARLEQARAFLALEDDDVEAAGAAWDKALEVMGRPMPLATLYYVEFVHLCAIAEKAGREVDLKRYDTVGDALVQFGAHALWRNRSSFRRRLLRALSDAPESIKERDVTAQLMETLDSAD